MESASSRVRPCSIEAMRTLLATLLVVAAGRDATGDATSVTATSATFNGTVDGATTAQLRVRDDHRRTASRRPADDRSGRLGPGHRQA